MNWKIRFGAAVFLLLLAGGVGIWIRSGMNAYPVFEDTYILEPWGFEKISRYDFVYSRPYPTSVMPYHFQAGGEKLESVLDNKGRQLYFTVQGAGAVCYLLEPQRPGSRVKLETRSRLLSMTPFLQVTRLDERHFALHYIVWDYYPSYKTKRFILPPNSRISDVRSTIKGYQVVSNTVLFRGFFPSFKKIDITLLFETDGTTRFVTAPAAPPLVKGSNIQIRIPAGSVDRPDLLGIRGDFSRGMTLRMRKEGGYYVYLIPNITNGIRYQIVYGNVRLADNSVTDRNLTDSEESETRLRILSQY